MGLFPFYIERQPFDFYHIDVVLLPHLEMPLHIFEERYKVMINECLEQKREFGVVNYDGTNIRSIGCTAEIRGVVKEYGDGRMDIMTQGKTRFVIKDMDQSLIYLQGHIENGDPKNENKPENH